MHVCACMSVCMYTYTHRYIDTYIHTYIHTYVCTYVRMHIHTYVCTYVRTYVHTYVHTHIHTYIHTYVHTYIRTYIHTYTGLMTMANHRTFSDQIDRLSSEIKFGQTNLLYVYYQWKIHWVYKRKWMSGQISVLIISIACIHTLGLKWSQHHWPRWPIDPNSNPGIWPGLVKVEAHTKTYISGMTNCLCVMVAKDYLQGQK